MLTSLDQVSGNYITKNLQAEGLAQAVGLRVGGPIIRDKLFFFYSYDQSRRNFPGTATASTSTAGVFAPASATLPAGNACGSGGAYTPVPTQDPVTGVFTANYPTGNWGACSLASVLGLNPGGTPAGYQAGAAIYQQSLGVFASFLGPVPRNSDQVINFPKVDYQINQRNHLIVEANRLRADSPNGVQTQQTNTYGRGSFGNDFVKQDYEIARLATTLNANMINEIRFQYGRDFEYESSSTPTGNEIPLTNNQFGFRRT